MTSLFSNTVSPVKEGTSSLSRRSSTLSKPPLRALYDLLIAPMEGVRHCSMHLVSFVFICDYYFQSFEARVSLWGFMGQMTVLSLFSVRWQNEE